MIPSQSASGRGGHPGTYTSTGRYWSMPLATEYESQYGPPEFEHEPKLMQYFGSGICSQTRMIDGIILSTHVPATIMTSACRGEAGRGITPKRMRSWRGMVDAAISIAQHARPNWNIHKEYLRPQFIVNLMGFGSSTLSSRPMGYTQSSTRRPHAYARPNRRMTTKTIISTTAK